MLKIPLLLLYAKNFKNCIKSIIELLRNCIYIHIVLLWNLLKISSEMLFRDRKPSLRKQDEALGMFPEDFSRNRRGRTQDNVQVRIPLGRASVCNDYVFFCIRAKFESLLESRSKHVWSSLELVQLEGSCCFIYFLDLKRSSNPRPIPPLVGNSWKV